MEKFWTRASDIVGAPFERLSNANNVALRTLPDLRQRRKISRLDSSPMTSTSEQPRRHPGGQHRPGARSGPRGRDRAARHEGPEEVTIPRVAERAGVHQATLYRRWGDVAGLVDDVVAERLGEVAPLPDTGTLRGDLELAAVRFAEAIAPLGTIMMRAAALATPDGRGSGRPADPRRPAAGDARPGGRTREKRRRRSPSCSRGSPRPSTCTRSSSVAPPTPATPGSWFAACWSTSRPTGARPDRTEGRRQHLGA